MVVLKSSCPIYNVNTTTTPPPPKTKAPSRCPFQVVENLVSKKYSKDTTFVI